MSFFTDPMKECVDLLHDHNNNSISNSKFKTLFSRSLAKVSDCTRTVGKIDFKFTLLHIATMLNDVSAANTLILNGVTPHKKDIFNMSSLDYAVKNNNKQLVELYTKTFEVTNLKNEVVKERKKRKYAESIYRETKRESDALKYELDYEATKRVKTEEKLDKVTKERDTYKKRWDNYRDSKRK